MYICEFLHVWFSKSPPGLILKHFEGKEAKHSRHNDTNKIIFIY